MYVKKFSVRDGTEVTGYGMFNTENSTFGVLEKKQALGLAKQHKLQPYGVYKGNLVATQQDTGFISKLTGRTKVEGLAMERCGQMCGYVDEAYIASKISTLIGEYIYMESKHYRLYLVGTLYVPDPQQYGVLQSALASHGCIIRGSGRYSTVDSKACVSINNVYDLRNLLQFFIKYDNLLMDISHVHTFNYDIAGEGLMYEQICENESKGIYFAELDSIHHYMGLISYVRGVSNSRCGKAK